MKIPHLSPVEKAQELVQRKGFRDAAVDIDQIIELCSFSVSEPNTSKLVYWQEVRDHLNLISLAPLS